MPSSINLSSGSAGALSVFDRAREDRTAERAAAIRSGGAAAKSGGEERVREVAEEFVSVFMNQVMKSMRATVHENPAMHGDNGEKFFQEMLDAEQAKSLSKGSGYGLTDLVFEAMMTSYRVAQPEVAEPSADSMRQEDRSPDGGDNSSVAAVP